MVIHLYGPHFLPAPSRKYFKKKRTILQKDVRKWKYIITYLVKWVKLFHIFSPSFRGKGSLKMKLFCLYVHIICRLALYETQSEHRCLKYENVNEISKSTFLYPIFFLSPFFHEVKCRRFSAFSTSHNFSKHEYFFAFASSTHCIRHRITLSVIV